MKLIVLGMRGEGEMSAQCQAEVGIKQWYLLSLILKPFSFWEAERECPGYLLNS